MSAKFTGIAPGRVNLIGEHTDYNGGWVLPTAIPQETRVHLRRRGDLTVEAYASSGREGSFLLGQERSTGTWLDYLQGATSELRKAGHLIGGFSARVVSRVPEGSGLSSSAALSIALLKACRDAFSLPLSDLELARLAQKVENEFVGARVGIMDPMAVCFAHPGSALFLDTRTLSFEEIPLPRSMELLVLGSGISHRNASGGYNKRRAECEEACRLLGLSQLRDLPPGSEEVVNRLPDPLRRRARHVVRENERVHAAVAALRASDPITLGRLFIDSHQSLRDDYEVSIPEIDTLVRLCLRDDAVFGARLTGGGFGGSIVAAVKAGEAARVGKETAAEYMHLTGHRAAQLVPEE